MVRITKLRSAERNFEDSKQCFKDLYEKYEQHHDDIQALLAGKPPTFDQFSKIQQNFKAVNASIAQVTKSLNNVEKEVAAMGVTQKQHSKKFQEADKAALLSKKKKANRSGAVGVLCKIGKVTSHALPLIGALANEVSQDVLLKNLDALTEDSAEFVTFLRSPDGKKILVTSPYIDERRSKSNVVVSFVGQSGTKRDVVIPSESLYYKRRITNPEKIDGELSEADMRTTMVISLEEIFCDRENVKLCNVPALTCTVPLYQVDYYLKWHHTEYSQTNIMWTSTKKLIPGYSLTDLIEVDETKFQFPVKKWAKKKLAKNHDEAVKYVFYE
eukprot:401260_1